MTLLTKQYNIDMAVSEGYWDGYGSHDNRNWYGEDEEAELWKAYEQGYAKGAAEYELAGEDQ